MTVCTSSFLIGGSGRDRQDQDSPASRKPTEASHSPGVVVMVAWRRWISLRASHTDRTERVW